MNTSRTTTTATETTPPLRTGLAALLLVLLAACGGSQGGDEAEASGSTATAATPLLDDDGQLMPSAVVPADARARTRAGHYATPEQAQALKRALGDRVLEVDVDTAGGGDPELAVGIAWGVQAAEELGNAAPVLVHASDPRLAADAAERLALAGHQRVIVVLQ
jgi:hypothetical protein